MRILLIEDDPAITVGLSGTLDDLGHQTVETETVHEAIEALRHHGVDLVISDLGLAKGVRAETLLEAIRSLHPEMPIIISTGLAPDEQFSLDDRMRLLMKPYSSTELEEAITSLSRSST